MTRGLQIETTPPQAVRTVEYAPVRVRDGTQLAARLWLPEQARSDPVPAILEYIPYRRRDGSRRRDAVTHPYLAARGYACVRVDIRGSGDSEGVLTDEYLPSELDDGEDVLAWIAEQPWCDGQVGMLGISWGGFTGLQLAARRPPALGAVIAASATDDRYTDDVHYMGGCLLGDNLSWASTMFAYNALPPDPAVVGAAWRQMWQDRLEGSGLWLETWLRHQQRDAYWRHGSVCEDYAAISVPVMAVSGWADGYSNAVLRLLEHLTVPRLGLIGPWSHVYPHLGTPGPAIGFLDEVVRWFDRWLKDVDNGIDTEPQLKAYLQDSAAPGPSAEHRPGRWVAEWAWPSPNVTRQRRALTRSRLLAPGVAAGEVDARQIRSPLSLGLFAGKWCSYASAPDLPSDQREENGGALVFDSAPLDAPLDLLGPIEAVLTVSVDKPVAMVAVRIIDVAPDGTATRITYGLLNLAHRDGHDRLRAVIPGEEMTVRVRCNDCAQRLLPGHRLRLAVSTSYWPLAWPPPEPVLLTLEPERSHLDLPVRGADGADTALRPFAPPVGSPPLATTRLAPARHNWVVTRDLAADLAQLEVIEDLGEVRIDEHGLVITRTAHEWYRATSNDFTSVEGEVHSVRALSRGDWHTETVARTHLSCTRSSFLLHATLDAYEQHHRVFAKTWHRTIARRGL